MFVFKFFAITESIYLQALLPNSEVFIFIKRANNQGRYFKEQETEIIISQTDRHTTLSNLFPIHIYISKRWCKKKTINIEIFPFQHQQIYRKIILLGHTAFLQIQLALSGVFQVYVIQFPKVLFLNSHRLLYVKILSHAAHIWCRRTAWRYSSEWYRLPTNKTSAHFAFKPQINLS
jgi:hypothetical protein